MNLRFTPDKPRRSSRLNRVTDIDGTEPKNPVRRGRSGSILIVPLPVRDEIAKEIKTGVMVFQMSNANVTVAICISISNRLNPTQDGKKMRSGEHDTQGKSESRASSLVQHRSSVKPVGMQL